MRRKIGPTLSAARSPLLDSDRAPLLAGVAGFTSASHRFFAGLEAAGVSGRVPDAVLGLLLLDSFLAYALVGAASLVGFAVMFQLLDRLDRRFPG